MGGWLLGLQHEVLVGVQAQQLAELLDAAGRVLGLDQHHVACCKADPGARDVKLNQADILKV